VVLLWVFPYILILENPQNQFKAWWVMMQMGISIISSPIKNFNFFKWSIISPILENQSYENWKIGPFFLRSKIKEKEPLFSTLWKTKVDQFIYFLVFSNAKRSINMGGGVVIHFGPTNQMEGPFFFGFFWSYSRLKWAKMEWLFFLLIFGPIFQG